LTSFQAAESPIDVLICSLVAGGSTKKKRNLGRRRSTAPTHFLRVGEWKAKRGNSVGGRGEFHFEFFYRLLDDLQQQRQFTPKSVGGGDNAITEEKKQRDANDFTQRFDEKKKKSPGKTSDCWRRPKKKYK
jgi:hypothetical protein